MVTVPPQRGQPNAPAAAPNAFLNPAPLNPASLNPASLTGDGSARGAGEAPRRTPHGPSGSCSVPARLGHPGAGATAIHIPAAPARLTAGSGPAEENSLRC